MSERFTKGPWTIWTSHHEIADTGDYYDEIGVKDKNGRQLCVMCGDLDDGIIEANAALIAAAPEMYDMLEEVKGKLDRSVRISIGHSMGAGWTREQAKVFFMEYIEINKRIKAVLQKARGKK